MQKERVLIIIYEKALLNLMILEVGDHEVELYSAKKVRIYPHSYRFSLADYILQVLSRWGEELGISLVREMVPFISDSAKEGISDIFIIAFHRDESLLGISKNVFYAKKDIQRGGAISISKFLAFKRLLYFSFEEAKTTVVSFSEKEGGVMKVVSETNLFDAEKLLQDEAFFKRINGFPDIAKKGEFKNLLLNKKRLPVFSERSLKGTLLEYVKLCARLEPFVTKKKLQIDQFGAGGFSENIVIIGGSESRIISNVEVELLAILSMFNIQGSSSIYYDQYGLFDFLHRSKKQILSDTVLSHFLLTFWGNSLHIRGPKKMKLDTESADVDIIDGDATRQIIPMYGRILSFTFLEGGSINLGVKKGFQLLGGRMKLEIKNATGHFVVDSRIRPVEKNYTLGEESDLIESWLKGLGSVV